MEYTEGRWITGIGNIGVDEPDHICVTLKENQRKILALTGYVGAGDEPESIANAHLIAAAPALYEALEAVLQEYNTDPNDDKFYKACCEARQALAQAEGKEVT